MPSPFPQARLAVAGVSLVFALLAAFTIAILFSMVAGHAPFLRLTKFFVPLPFYLAALWLARSTIVRIDAGMALRSAISPMLTRIGWALFLGGLVQVWVVPWLGMFEAHGAFGNFDVNAITLGAVGITLVMVARLVKDAELDRAELDEIL